MDSKQQLSGRKRTVEVPAEWRPLAHTSGHNNGPLYYLPPLHLITLFSLSSFLWSLLSKTVASMPHRRFCFQDNQNQDHNQYQYQKTAFLNQMQWLHEMSIPHAPNHILVGSSSASAIYCMLWFVSCYIHVSILPYNLLWLWRTEFVSQSCITLAFPPFATQQKISALKWVAPLFLHLQATSFQNRPNYVLFTILFQPWPGGSACTPKGYKVNSRSGNTPRLHIQSIPSWGAYRRQRTDVSLSLWKIQ